MCEEITSRATTNAEGFWQMTSYQWMSQRSSKSRNLISIKLSSVLHLHDHGIL